MKKVLVLGGGFAGVKAAIELQKKKIFDVTLISDRSYLFLYPISIWIPVQLTSFEKTKVSLLDIQKKHGFKIITDQIVNINPEGQTVEGKQQSYPYDYLVIAMGSSKMTHKGIEHTYSICGQPEVSEQIREQVDALVNTGKGIIAVGFGGNPADTSAMRGGPAFELIFNLHNYLKKKKIRSQFNLVFFAPMANPGGKMGPKAPVMTANMFEKYGIKKQTGKKIIEFLPKGVRFEDDSVLTTDLTLFIPAGKGHSLFQNSHLPLTEAGFIKTDDTGLVQGFTNIYVAGDAAALTGPDWVAKQGHLAEIMGTHAAQNIFNTEKGIPTRESITAHFKIICIMDTGKGAAFVFRNAKKALLIPMPIVGHWLKKAWGLMSRYKMTGRFS